MAPFFEDCYRQIAVREYARIMKFTPPTASKILKEYYEEGYLLMQKERGHLLFVLNRDNKNVVDFSRLYWKQRLDILVHQAQKNLIQPTIILFGSAAKAELTPNSDIDIAIFGEKKVINIENIEKAIGRRVTLYWFSSLQQIKNKHLLNNILNGIILCGRLKW